MGNRAIFATIAICIILTTLHLYSVVVPSTVKLQGTQVSHGSTTTRKDINKHDDMEDLMSLFKSKIEKIENSDDKEDTKKEDSKEEENHLDYKTIDNFADYSEFIEFKNVNPTLASVDLNISGPVLEEALREARRKSFLKYGAPVSTPALDESVPFEQFSHVKFFGQAGLGHRLLRHAGAAYSARVKGMAIRGYWSETVFHNDTKDLFLMLFDPYTREDFAYVNHTNKTLEYNNELGPDGASIVGTRYTGGLEGQECLCTNDEVQVHYSFFLQLRNKYVRRDIVQAFMRQYNYAKHTVFGIHIRAGSGRRTIFTKRTRDIPYEPESWVRSLLTALRTNYPEETLPRPPLICIVTDDQRYETLFSRELNEQGLDWPVVRLDKKSVNLSQASADEEVEAWHSMLQKSFILSHSNILIAGTYSSFTQSLPLYLTLEGPEERRVARDTFCEVVDRTKAEGDRNASIPKLQMYCYNHMMQWCCGDGARNPHHRKMPKFVSPAHRPYGRKQNIRTFEPGEFFSFENGWGYGMHKKILA
jgi:hypothetical protein